MLKKLSPIVATLVMLCLVAGCKQKIEPCLLDECQPPKDKAPAITLVSPTNNNILGLAGTYAAFYFRLDDNEALKVFRVTGQIFNQKDSLIGTEYLVQEDVAIQGKTSLQPLVMIIPATLLPGFKIRLSAYAIDTKGAYNKTIAWVNVVDDIPLNLSGSVPIEYKDYTIYSKLSATHNNQSYFSFVGINPPVNMNSVDVMETSSVAGTFSRILTTGPIYAAPAYNPNVFVMTDAQHFNYDQLTYTTTYQAYYSNPQPKATTKPLEVGDIVIVRAYTQAPVTNRFVIMRVKEVNDDPTGDDNDNIKFDYKYTYL